MHSVIRDSAVRPAAALSGHSQGFGRFSAVDRKSGAVHTAIGICEIDAGGEVESHVQSYEEFFYVTAGEPTLILDGRAYPLAPGACGVVPVGVAHGWQGPPNGVARWIEMSTPIPRGPGEPADIFFLGPQATWEFSCWKKWWTS